MSFFAPWQATAGIWLLPVRSDAGEDVMRLHRRFPGGSTVETHGVSTGVTLGRSQMPLASHLHPQQETLAR